MQISWLVLVIWQLQMLPNYELTNSLTQLTNDIVGIKDSPCFQVGPLARMMITTTKATESKQGVKRSRSWPQWCGGFLIFATPLGLGFPIDYETWSPHFWKAPCGRRSKIFFCFVCWSSMGWSLQVHQSKHVKTLGPGCWLDLVSGCLLNKIWSFQRFWHIPAIPI